MFKIHCLTRTDVARKDDSSKTSEMKLVAGLGNPGDEYRDTFHNAGSMFVDYLAGENQRGFRKYRDFEFLKAGGLIAVKPLGFMNRSGKPIKRAIKYFGVGIKNLIVVHDDSDIELGRYKVSSGHGSAGHKGIESICKELKTDEFDRIRIGVRKRYESQGKHRRRAGDFILNRMDKEDKVVLKKIFLEIKALYFET